jgi:AcrR family transcriptional regulator
VTQPESQPKPVSDRPDPRVTRTARALEQAIVETASQRPVSQITVAELARRAGVTRATVYNRYGSPLNLLIQVLDTDLQRGHRQEEQRRVSGGYTTTENLRFAIGEVADHITRYIAIYQHALHDPADNGVYEALIRHFIDYSHLVLARCTHPDLPDTNHQVIAHFVSHGFAGAIKAWLNDDSTTKHDLVEAVVACTPTWWNSGT